MFGFIPELIATLTSEPWIAPKASRYAPWDNPGNYGQLWVALLRDIGPSVVLNGGEASFDPDGQGTIRLSVPAVADIAARVEPFWPADTVAVANCRDNHIAVMRKKVYSYFDVPFRLASEAVAAGVPDESIWPVIDALKTAHSQTEAYLSNIVKNQAQVAKRILACANKTGSYAPPKVVMKAPASGLTSAQANMMKKVQMGPSAAPVQSARSEDKGGGVGGDWLPLLAATAIVVVGWRILR